MPIDHSKCDHERTRAARAKCRRGGDSTPRKAKASSKDVDFSGSGGQKGQTPRDRDKQCDVCGVERIAYFGLDVLSGVRLYVGERCYYMVKRDPDGAVPLD